MTCKTADLASVNK